MSAVAQDTSLQAQAEVGALIEAGVAAHRRNATEEARRHYLDALQRDPQCADAWHLIGVLMQQLGGAEASIQFIARAIELSPRQAMYYANLGTALHALKRLEEAAHMYRQALMLDPSFVDAACNLGNTLFQLERDDQAAQAYAEAIAIAPADGRAWYGLGQMFFALERDSEALDAFQHAVDASPADADARFALARSLLQRDDVVAAQAQYRAFKALLPAAAPIRHTQEELLPLQPVAQFCSERGREYTQFLPERSFALPAPAFDNPVVEVPAATGVLAPAYVANIGPADVFGWHDTIVAHAPRTVLYDMATRPGSRALECEHGSARLVSARHALIDGCKESGERIARGLMLAGRGWDSYAHWVVDFLPRLMLFEQCPRHADWPILVDAGLYPQQMEGLRQLVGSGRIIVPLARDTRYTVEELAVASDLSDMRMQSYRPRALPLGDGAVVAPEALSFLRARLLGAAAQRQAPAQGRRLFVSRRHQTSFRRLVNEAALEQIFVDHGFEVIHPETMSFADQVRLFNGASVVAGAAGSNMIDTIFCGPGTRILMLAMWHPRLNYHFFANTAALLGHQLLHVLGRIVARHDYYYQSDFMVEPDDVRHALRLLDID